MGRERAIIRWEVRQQMLLEELHRLEQALAAPPEQEPSEKPAPERLAELRAKLQALGPSPKAKMG
ncbi:MAG TPA: hypothetical protein VKT82_21865 [Ktedonobacterales bacterium]|nr:hypothetical protein [Ktedonobacterales bacterium]